MSFDVAGTIVKVGDVVAALTDGGFSCIVPYRYYKVDYVLQHGVGILDEFTRKSWFMTPDEILLVKQEDEIMRLEQNETVVALKEVVSKLEEMLVVLKGTKTVSELDEKPKRVAMPDWKEGDKVRCIKSVDSYREGEVYEVGYCRVDVMDFGVLDAEGDVMFLGCIASDWDGCINENILDYFELLEEAQEPEKKGRSVKFKVGDKVRIREGFDAEGHNGGDRFLLRDELYFAPLMMFHGVRTIAEVDFEGDYMFEGSHFCYTDNMLELA